VWTVTGFSKSTVPLACISSTGLVAHSFNPEHWIQHVACWYLTRQYCGLCALFRTHTVLQRRNGDSCRDLRVVRSLDRFRRTFLLVAQWQTVNRRVDSVAFAVFVVNSLLVGLSWSSSCGVLITQQQDVVLVFVRSIDAPAVNNRRSND